MRYYVCAMRDSASDAFGVPMFMASLGQATRSFADEVNRSAENNMLNKHPEDFELFHIGYYDDQTATFEAVERRSLIRGADAKRD